MSLLLHVMMLVAGFALLFAAIIGALVYELWTQALTALMVVAGILLLVFAMLFIAGTFAT